MQRFLSTCPGLVGDVARYVDSVLPVKQPSICLAAAISFVGALYSKRLAYKPPSGKVTEPCVFAVVVADTGSGKTSAQDVLEDIVRSAHSDTSTAGFLAGVPASDSGLLSTLAEQPRRLLMWDEIGLCLSAYNKSKSSHEAMILSTCMQVFSKAGRPYRGKQYSTKSRVDIQDPYLSIFGASTFGRFFGALTQDFLEDGFLPRWLLFFEDTKRKPKLSTPNTTLFESIVSRVQAIESWTTEVTRGDIAEAIPQLMPRKKLFVEIQSDALPNDPIGVSSLDEWKSEIDDTLQSAPRQSVRRVLYTRAFEQTIKLCLILTDAVSAPSVAPIAHVTPSPPVVSSQSVRWAIDFCRELINAACEECERSVKRNDRARELDALRDQIANCIDIGERISKSALAKRCYRICDGKTRQAIVNDLVESEMWIEESEQVDEWSRKKSVFYTRVS